MKKFLKGKIVLKNKVENRRKKSYFKRKRREGGVREGGRGREEGGTEGRGKEGKREGGGG